MNFNNWKSNKEKYLPKLATGEWKASYCLTEPGSGSDALSAKTKAVLSEDGQNYILNGQKMWITNAGFADIFIVFAQVDGNKFTGFIVEKEVEGLTLGNEEHKMGIKGSSTRQVFLQDCKVSKSNINQVIINILDEGEGFKEKDTSKIFNRFYSNRPDKFGQHSGLGLNIVKNLVDLHNATIKASNRIDQKGASMEIIFPKA